MTERAQQYIDEPTTTNQGFTRHQLIVSPGSHCSRSTRKVEVSGSSGERQWSGEPTVGSWVPLPPLHGTPVLGSVVCQYSVVSRTPGQQKYVPAVFVVCRCACVRVCLCLGKSRRLQFSSCNNFSNL